MKTLGLMICCVLGGLTCLALGEFGEFNSVRQSHPEFFRPGVVEDARLGDEPWYVYCGEAEKCFNEEQDSELYEEAEVQAKLNFYSYFQKKEKNPAVKVGVATARKLYQFTEGKMYYVVLGVPKSGVSVSVPVAKPAPPVTVQKKPASQPSLPAAQVVVSPAKETEKPQTPHPAVPAVVSKPTVTPVSPPVTSDAVPAVGIAVSAAGQPAAEAPADVKQPDEIGDAEKLKILRARLVKNPGDFHTRIRIAKIFDSQGNEKRALRNYSDAARLLVLAKDAAVDEKIDVLSEIASYEEGHGAGALALKHYRALQRMGGKGAAIATGRISRLLLCFK